MKLQEHKRIQAILFFALKSPENKINRLKLMKLLWLSDRIHLNRYGRTILKDEYFALPFGPIPSNTMNLSEQTVEDVFTVRGKEIEAEDQCDLKYFSKSDIIVLEEVWERFGIDTDIVIKDYSHLFPEWKRFEKELNDPDLPKSYPIEMDDFFKDPEIEANFKKEMRSDLSHEVYQKYRKIQEILTR